MQVQNAVVKGHRGKWHNCFAQGTKPVCQHGCKARTAVFNGTGTFSGLLYFQSTCGKVEEECWATDNAQPQEWQEETGPIRVEEYLMDEEYEE